jgi:hypothetical protein
VEAAVAAAIEGLATKEEVETAAASATEGMYTQTDIDAAVAEATEDMYTQAEYDAAVFEATEDTYTQAEYDAEEGEGDNRTYTQLQWEETALAGLWEGTNMIPNMTSWLVLDSPEYSEIEEDVNSIIIDYMEDICSDQVSDIRGVFASGTCTAPTADGAYTPDELAYLAVESLYKGVEIIPNLKGRYVEGSDERSEIQEDIDDAIKSMMEGICSGEISNGGTCSELGF